MLNTRTAEVNPEGRQLRRACVQSSASRGQATDFPVAVPSLDGWFLALLYANSYVGFCLAKLIAARTQALGVSKSAAFFCVRNSLMEQYNVNA